MRRARVGGIEVGDGLPVRVCGVINVSPESFYRGSVVRPEEAGKAALRLVEEGADCVDLGGQSSAPYLSTTVSEDEELKRIRAAMKAIAESVSVPVSVDTTRSRVADVALALGASAINDITGLKGDPKMSRVIAERGAALIAVAHGPHSGLSEPVETVIRHISESLKIAEKEGIRDVIVDPAIGFYRESALPWYVWDSEVLGSLERIKELERPVCVGVSRKSFLGEITGLSDPSSRLIPTVASTAIAVYKGANCIRAHDVKESKYAINVATAIANPRSFFKV